MLREQRDLGDSEDIGAQWNGLILEPLRRISLVGPVVVVIDAFDECSSADARSRHLLLKHLTESSAGLPSNLRILVTSRPEHDVMNVLDLAVTGYPHVSLVRLDDSREEAMLGVASYIRHKLAAPGRECEAGLDNEDFQLLTEKSEGLFCHEPLL